MSFTIYCQKNCTNEAISTFNGEPYLCKKHLKKKKEIEGFYVSVSYLIITSGGKEMAKRIFSNMVKEDPNHPIKNLKVRKE